MYCHYCGRPAGATCAACGHRICPAHTRRWLVASVCKKCNRAVWFGVASVAVLAAGVAVVAFAVHAY